jgi:hypothetical protein
LPPTYISSISTKPLSTVGSFPQAPSNFRDWLRIVAVPIAAAIAGTVGAFAHVRLKVRIIILRIVAHKPAVDAR